MAETSEEIHSRAVAAAGPDGRLPAPALHEWEIFPWEAVDGRVGDEILPPGPEDRWLADLATVARALTAHSGRTHLDDLPDDLSDDLP